MRKLTYAIAMVAVTACFAFAGPILCAQTTFATTNNTNANLTIDRMDQDATVVTIIQQRGTASYVEISQSTVVKDPQTGITFKLLILDCNIDPITDIETNHLVFAPFIDEVLMFDLIDPLNQNASLFFSKINAVTTTEAIAATEY